MGEKQRILGISGNCSEKIISNFQKISFRFPSKPKSCTFENKFHSLKIQISSSLCAMETLQCKSRWTFFVNYFKFKSKFVVEPKRSCERKPVLSFFFVKLLGNCVQSSVYVELISPYQTHLYYTIQCMVQVICSDFVMKQRKDLFTVMIVDHNHHHSS